MRCFLSITKNNLVMLLIEPYLVKYPVGIYSVENYNDLNDCYYIDGMAHHRSRFVQPSTLVLELF